MWTLLGVRGKWEPAAPPPPIHGTTTTTDGGARELHPHTLLTAAEVTARAGCQADTCPAVAQRTPLMGSVLFAT